MRRSRLVVVSVTTLTVAITIVTAIADLLASRYLNEREAWRARELVAERARAEGYKRHVLIQEPIEQNAAVWYRRAFANLHALPSESAQAVAGAIGSRRGDDSSLETLASEFCLEAKSRRIQDAMRCTMCDWGLV